MSRGVTPESFRKDTAEHVMAVKYSASVYRHVRFAKPGTSHMSFELVTWPGHLAYSGDMGCFVFSRLHDMFEFFRTDGSRTIDFGYWAEKLQAVDSHGHGASEFSYERFRDVINGYRLRWVRDGRQWASLDKEERRELWEAVEEVLDGDETEHGCYERARDFSWSIDPRSRAHVYSFEDLWEHRFTEYTFRFLWCCHAIAWGIQQFDQLPVEVAA